MTWAAARAVDAPAGVPEPSRGVPVQVVAGNDTSQAMAAYILWRAWTLELYGHEMDDEKWLIQQQAKRTAGNFIQLIAWDGPVPVAMCEGYLMYDVQRCEYETWGDKAYALPEYRGLGVWKAMVQANLDLSLLMGTKSFHAPIGCDATADMLCAMYERRGFTVTGRYLRKEA